VHREREKMSETDNNKQEQKSKISKWATSSMYSALIGIALILLSYVFLEQTVNKFAYNIFSGIIRVGCILIVFGFVAGIIGLICIKASKGKLKGTGFAISGIIISSIPIAFFIFQLYIFYMVFIYEKPYDNSNPKAIIAKVEKVYDFNFPEKIENLKAAEKTSFGIDHTFIARFTADQNSFAKLRNSLSKKDYYFEEITDELLTENGKRYTDLWISNKRGSMWRRNAPEWLNEEIPKGKVYELYLRCKTMQLSFIYVELPDSNEVVVDAEGWRKFKDKLIGPEEANDLKWTDVQKE